ncbi:MAG: carboxypeptidase regulatory-like domain-containing protein [Kofleriaceae bacterium]
MLRVVLPLLVSSIASAGSVKGTVLFEGEPPEQPKLKRNVDPKCSQDRRDEAIVVEKGKLRDVMVRIKNGSTGSHPAPESAVVIDQQDCMYSPRVVGIVAGQKLSVKNSDNTFHNVHGVLVNKDLFNKPMAPKADTITLDPSAAKADDVVGLQCDVHGWMKAYVVVNDSPYFAVTAADGTFEIKDLPVGDYTLEAWHPTLGTKTLKISIGKAKRGDVTARFSYKAREM